MRSCVNVLLGAGVLLTVAARPADVAAQSASGLSAPDVQATLDRYCVTCHSARLKTGGLVLQGLDVSQLGERADVWESVVRKLRGSLMPPAGAPRPEPAVYSGLRTWLERGLDRAAAEAPNPGRTESLHRMNRAEYRNAIRDLLEFDVDVTEMLPVDDASYGFDNVAANQRMNATLMERYLAAAQQISRVAVGTPAPFPDQQTFRVPLEARQDHHLDGLPFGTRGGMAVTYNFPTDGEYSIRLRLARASNSSEDVPRYDVQQDLELSLDGAPIRVFSVEAGNGAQDTVDRRLLDADWVIRVPVRAGPREITATFLNRAPALLEIPVRPYLRPYPDGGGAYSTRRAAYLDSIVVSGPFTQSGVSDTPSRERIFVCQPATQAEEATCATTILSTLARRAYRRPVTQAEVADLMGFFERGREERGFEGGIERALQALLVSPKFLFRIQQEPADVAPGGVYRIADLNLASRLSFFLWSSIPDEPLLAAAEAGTLSQPAVLEAQTRRMLADPRAEALVENFAGQWLFLRNIAKVDPNRDVDPDFDDDLRHAFRRETELFFQSIVREDRSVLGLLTADHTYVNERLARHYDLPNVTGDHFRRVIVEDPNRRGLLGKGSVLAVTSYAHRTSPVVRGKWILENLLGTPPPAPPANVPPLEEATQPGTVLPMRERMAKHRANPVCASCHSMMDPLGFALENFDLVGRWRVRDESFEPIDASGSLPDGTKFDGVAGLRDALVAQPDRFVTTLATKLLTYALGRGIEAHDEPAVRRIVRDAAPEYRFSSIVLGVVNSLPFQMRRAEGSREQLAQRQ
ncbi:MAG: DUF1592 domain-containing protein [Acidimicrobiia bacterium]|nr:DUF1592 domain-containing protein [Acidimicrobiia bacterium]